MTRINTSETPAHDAAIQVTHSLLDHKDEEILLLLSGGSSLAILDHVDTDVLGKNVTIMMGDERFTEDPKGNNFVQLTQTDFYADAIVADTQFISTAVEVGETHQTFTQKLQTALSNYLKTHPDTYVLAVFGIGNDCHTASIFPKDTQAEFDTTYTETADAYIGIAESDNDYVQRATITPDFITNSVDEIIVYAAGKQETLLMLQFRDKVHNCPVRIVLDHPNSTLYTDAEIANI